MGVVLLEEKSSQHLVKLHYPSGTDVTATSPETLSGLTRKGAIGVTVVDSKVLSKRLVH